MTNVKRNDFGEGLLDFDEGQKVTFRNLDTSSRAEFDGDSTSVLRLQSAIIKHANENQFLQVWQKPESGKGYGRFVPLEKGWVEVTIKDMEHSPPTYLKHNIKTETMLSLIKENGLKPKWIQRKDGIDTKVSE